MKKIAIIFRGPVRPDAHSVAKNIDALARSFSDYDVDTYLVTWNSDEARKLMIEHPTSTIIALKEPTAEFALSKLTTKTRSNALPDRSYKAFWTVRTLMRLIGDTDIPYDYIVLSRTDLHVEIDNPEAWFQTDSYVMPTQFMSPINDQFGIATPSVMRAAWDYQNMTTLNQLYGASLNPEECLQRIMEMNRVRTTIQKAAVFEINTKRHFGETDYPHQKSDRVLARKLQLAKLKQRFLALLGLT